MTDELRLERVVVAKLRCLEAVQLDDLAPCNVFFGDNGSGKTSLLESLALLSLGKSFQPGQGRDLVQHGAAQLKVEARVVRAGRSGRVAVEKTARETRASWNGQQVARSSDLAARLPLLPVTPESIDITRGGPAQRRQLLDRTMFHVEHRFLPTYRDYQRAAAQRYALLRGRRETAAIGYWHDQMTELAARIDHWRSLAYQDLINALATIPWPEGLPAVRLRYRRGWPAESDLKTLLEEQAKKKEPGPNPYGPQRASLVIETEDAEVRHRFSRGQARVVATALLLAQWQLISRAVGVRPLILFDELGAELAPAYRHWLGERLRETGAQLFVTMTERALAPAPLSGDDVAVFHVEHGTITRSTEPSLQSRG